MIDYFVTDKDGEIKLRGTVESEDSAKRTLGKDQCFHSGVVEPDATHYIDGVFYNNKPPLSYAELRKIKYPPVSDLADAMYWISMGDSTKMELYLAACEAVKAKYPKID